jgi:hypothetical protein
MNYGKMTPVENDASVLEPEFSDMLSIATLVTFPVGSGTVASIVHFELPLATVHSLGFRVIIDIAC